MAMRKSITLEKRGIQGQEIADWFLDRAGGKREGKRISGPGWMVEFLEERQKMLGPMHFPVVVLRIEAEDDLFSDLLYRFRIYFLRGGA
jgi:hypothetical protein